MLSEQIPIGERDLEPFVEHQKSHQQILLVPENFLIDDPLSRIVPGQENVVEVNPYSRAQARQYIEEYPIHVRTRLAGVRTVDEEFVT